MGASMRRLIPPVLFLLCLGLMALLCWLSPIAHMLDWPWRWLGFLPILIGLGMGAAGARQFIKQKTNLLPFKEADKLVTSGPFRFTRNPMYLGLALCLLGASLLMGALSPVLGVVLFVVVADRWYIRTEEQMLRGKFSAAFDDYCVRVRRWI